MDNEPKLPSIPNNTLSGVEIQTISKAMLADLTDTVEQSESGLSKAQLMSATEALQTFSDLSFHEVEDLFMKNTPSFRCLAQILISRSSLLRQPLYHFPPLIDPGIDDAFDYVEPEAVFDDIGCEKYKSQCKDSGMVPISRILNSLNTDTLNLKYYGLSAKQIKAISNTLMLNNHVKNVIFQDNWMSPESVYDVGEMLRENNCIETLDMRECRIGPEGVANLIEGIGLTQTLVELDLSRNDLQDQGIEILCNGLRDNQQLRKLDISHNRLGDKSGVTLGNFFKENTTINYLDLSWNDFYNSAGMKPLCLGLMENKSVKYLNLAWNAIGTKECFAPVIKYLKETEVLEHLDLSNNRLMDVMIKMIRAGILGNGSLISINLGFNLITPDDALFLLKTFTTPTDSVLKLEYMDLENVFVNKNFVPVWKKLTKQGKIIRIQGVLRDYKIHGPNQIKLLFERARFLAEKPKKKKDKKDFGHFIYSLPEESIGKKELTVAAKKFKMKKVDVDLQAALIKKFQNKSKDLNVADMKEKYLNMYPDTTKPEIKPKKEKKGKRKGKGQQQPVTPVEIAEIPEITEIAAVEKKSLLGDSIGRIKRVTVSEPPQEFIVETGESENQEEIQGAENQEIEEAEIEDLNQTALEREMIGSETFPMKEVAHIVSDTEQAQIETPVAHSAEIDNSPSNYGLKLKSKSEVRFLDPVESEDSEN